MSAEATLQARYLRREAAELSARFPALLVEAQRVAATVAQGIHGRRRIGSGDAFWQFRRYQPGDAASAVDWRQSAKRQKAFVRENEWEAAESVWLWCDRSASMHWQSDLALGTKLERAMVLSLALADLLARGGEQVALLGSGQRPAAGRAVVERMAEALAAPADHQPSAPPRAKLSRFGRLVLISDFLVPFGEIESWLARYSGEGVKGHLLHIIDPAEAELPFTGRARIEGLEGETPFILGRVEDVASEWRAKLARRDRALGDLCRRMGWSFAAHRTDRPATAALLGLYFALGGE